MINRIKKLFLVNTPEGGVRLSKDMVGNTVVLVSSLLVAVGGVGQAIAGAEAAAITGGIMAISNIMLRFNSDGGVIKARETSKLTDDDNEGWGVG